MSYGSNAQETYDEAIDRIVYQIAGGARTFDSVRIGIGSPSVGRGAGGDAAAIASGAGAIRMRVTAMFDNMGITRANYNVRPADPVAGVGPTAPPGRAATPTQGPRRAGGSGRVDLTNQRNAFELLRDVLKDYGLEDLGPWAQEQIRLGRSNEAILVDLRQQPTYKARFPGMEARRKAGLNAISESQYLEYETVVRQTARQFGLPESFVNGADDVARYLGNDISAAEFAQRVEGNYARVINAPPEVRWLFGEWYGAGGDAALGMFFLDPDKALPELERYVNTGMLGGIAARNRIALSKERADALSRMGITPEQGEQGFAQIGEMDALFTETVTEGRNMAAEQEGVDAAFNVNPDAARSLRRRQEEREAAFGGSATPGLTRTGSTYGRANRDQ